MRKLLDFDVVIESNGDRYRTRVIASPAGEAQTDFVLPFTEKDLRILILEVIGSIGRVRRGVRRIESQERRLLEIFGGKLFQAAFSGAVRDCLARSRAAAESRNAGLRIRLRLPGILANIPWEYLYDAEYGFLSLSPETALVRYVEMPAPVRPFPISPPLRVLAMISAPSDVPQLQSEEEWFKLNESLGDLIDRGMVKVDRLGAGTLSALQRPLRLNEYHVLHFVGHGVYDEDAQDGALALEGPNRNTRLVTGRDLGLMIRGHRSLRLVVLNACEGARSAPGDPFGGVAQALVRQGIPAVIAMQFEISDPAALVFSQCFYQAIADHLPIEVAMTEARKAMFAEGNEVEWATPVLYLRSSDGRIFGRARITKTERQAERRAREEAEEEARLEAERRAREEAEKEARLEAERRAREEAEKEARLEAERRAREEAEKEARLEAERRAREEAEKEARLEAERRAREEAEKEARLEAERRAREEAEKEARLEAERRAREEAEKEARLEAERRAREEAEKEARQKANREAREKIARQARERAEQQAREEAEEEARQRADRLGRRNVVRRAREKARLRELEKQANATGRAGRPAAARDQLAALLPVRERVSGPNHAETLTIRRDLARWTGEAGDPVAARDQLAALLTVREPVLGPRHPEILTIRAYLARFTAEAGNAAV